MASDALFCEFCGPLPPEDKPCERCHLWESAAYLAEPCQCGASTRGVCVANTCAKVQEGARITLAMDALEQAHTFIRDGVEFGHIKDEPDTNWRKVLRKIRQATNALESHVPTMPGGVLSCTQCGQMNRVGQQHCWQCGATVSRKSPA